MMLEQTAVTLAPMVEIDHIDSLSWAAEHCGVPVIREIQIDNPGDDPLPPSTLEVGLGPDLGAPVRIPVPEIPAKGTWTIQRVAYRPPAGRLRQLLEVERGELSWHLMQEGICLAQGVRELKLLPCHHWPGNSQPLGLLTAFVTPNHPVIPIILRKVAERLKAASGDPAINGYQARSPLRVKAQVMALFEAIQSLGITYIGHSASFETTGQKVRLPDMVLKDQLANCLDMTLLMASCLEQMDLRPLIIFIKGHAFPGVWLVEERFPEGIVEDAARLRNLMALDQILVWDSSATLQQPPLPFSVVERAGHQHLAEDAAFGFALDVFVLRGEKFLPLPIRDVAVDRAGEASPEGVPAPPPRDELMELLTEAAREAARPDPLPRSPQVINRFQRWKDRLLDLSLRNKLLNYKPVGGSALPLEVPDLGTFEDLLAAERTFDLLPKPGQDSRDARDLRLLEVRGDLESWRQQRLQDLKRLTLHSPLTPGEFWERARKLDLQARTDLEEGGVATLFASMGILKWFESPESVAPRFAPLMLYPVQLTFERQRRRVQVKRLPEDPVTNFTLIEKMRRDFGVDLTALTLIEGDESGLDIPQLLREARSAIQRMPRWEVLEEAHLGHFTFAKFLVWKDLEDNSNILLQNPIIHHLAQSEETSFPAQGEAADAQELDQLPPRKLPCVMDADSTQLAAVASALKGRSFVLQGPPGTGKSQTITNLIACALAEGKSVLFVSEKMAALEVVHHRLKQAGLEDFCLELHSHKANRRQVLESLQKTLERTDRVRLEGLDHHEAELQTLRAELNAYAEALHEQRPLGLSLYQASARVLELRDLPGLGFPQPVPFGLAEATFHPWRSLVDAFAARAEAVEPALDHAWHGTHPVEWSHVGQERLEASLHQYSQDLAALPGEAKIFWENLHIPMPNTFQAMVSIRSEVDTLIAGLVPEEALDATQWAALVEDVGRFRQESEACAVRRKALNTRWKEGLWSLDLGSLREAYARHAHAFPLFRWFGLWGARKQLGPQSVQGAADPMQVLGDLTEAIALKQEEERLKQQGAKWTRRVRPFTLDQWEELTDRAPRVRAALEGLAQVVPVDTLPTLRSLCLKGPDAAWKVAFEAMTSALTRVEASRGDLSNLLGLGPSHLEAFAAARAQVERWITSMAAFRAWAFYREEVARLEGAQLGFVVQAFEEGRMPSGQIGGAFERAVLAKWCAAVRDAEPVLRGFEGPLHHRRVSQFRALDRRWMDLSRTLVIRQLETRLPILGANVADGSEMGILLRETKKKARFMAIRRLIQALPTLLPRLKPCLLMSPMSVAQYLPADGTPFDLLVFDEASQIATHDAIGTLARGQQVIVVGDSKQLPPTTFFSRNLDDEDAATDENDVVELESILDEAIAKQMPQQWLGWHYRSRHESLIDFSNRHYYEGRLHIFPAAHRRNEHLGIGWNPVPEGVYQSAGCGNKKEERTNPIEAQALVRYLVETLRHTAPGARSFGVVTFSMSQQRLVQDLLDEQRAQHPEIEGHFQSAEPVFVKNLENVQGDERDEILFSIGYAKDQNGRLRMHFGPLSVSGGERRLNVAITRARAQLRVFSTLTHDQVDLRRTQATGTHHLRAFLQFAAEHGTSTPASHPSRRHASAFERELHKVLHGWGYEVHTQIGCGGYRIDLAVLDPLASGRYLLGLECDGPAYHGAPTARDRDRLRHQVLEGLGWRLHRVWSSDWTADREREIKRLRDELDRAKASESEPDPAHEATTQNLDEAPYQAPPEPLLAAETVKGYTASLPVSQARPYIQVELPSPGVADPDQFYWPQANRFIEEQTQVLVGGEGPIHVDEAAGRIVRAWGWTMLTKRGRGHLETRWTDMARRDLLVLLGEYLWSPGMDPKAYEGYRTTAEGQPLRDTSHIAYEEVSNVIHEVLESNISLSEEDLLKETARLFGNRRVTSKALEGLRPAIGILEKMGRIIRTGRNIRLTS